MYRIYDKATSEARQITKYNITTIVHTAVLTIGTTKATC